MVSRKLNGAYAFSAFLLLTAGVLIIALSVVWRAPNLLRNLIITSMDLDVSLLVGVMYLLTFALAVAAIIQPNHVTLGFVILNWTLIFNAMVTVAVGTFIWFFTLKERNNYHLIYSKQTPAVMQGIQDLLQCCGYFTSTDLVVAVGICQDPATAATVQPCVGPITSSADFTLNNIFSSIYGFMAIITALFLSSMCVIKVRAEEERFRRIDDKRGGRGFV